MLCALCFPSAGLHRIDSRLAQGLGHPFPFQPAFHEGLRADLRDCCGQSAQQAGLRIGFILEAQAAACVRLAGEHKGLDPFRVAQRAQISQQVDDGG